MSNLPYYSGNLRKEPKDLKKKARSQSIKQGEETKTKQKKAKEKP